MKICINGGNMIINKVCMIGIRHGVDDTRIYYKESKSLIKHGYYLTIIANKGKSIPKCNYKILSGNIILKLIKFYRIRFECLSFEGHLFMPHYSKEFISIKNNLIEEVFIDIS